MLNTAVRGGSDMKIAHRDLAELTQRHTFSKAFTLSK